MERKYCNKGLINNHQINSSNIKTDENTNLNLEYLENLRMKREMELNSLINMRKITNEKVFKFGFKNIFI